MSAMMTSGASEKTTSGAEMGHARSEDEDSGARALPAKDDVKGQPVLPGELLSRLAHDIRSPLGLLSGALEELRADLSDQLDDSHKRMLDLAERGLVRLQRMATVLQTAGELERGYIELDPAERDVTKLIRASVEDLEGSDPRRSVEVDLDMRDGVTFPLDEMRFDEALREIIGQARRGARTAVKITADDSDEALVVRIEDDGHGWTKAQREQAFNRLYTPEDRSGTGLGLSVARDLVRAHGGDVVIQDSTLPPGRPGTIGGAFVITLPRS